jgi:hypothetical protein
MRGMPMRSPSSLSSPYSFSSFYFFAFAVATAAFWLAC